MVTNNKNVHDSCSHIGAHIARSCGFPWSLLIWNNFSAFFVSHDTEILKNTDLVLWMSLILGFS